METWWVRGLLAASFLLLAYAFASLAIDSGNLVEYLVTILLVWWGVKHAYRAVRFAFFA